MHVKLCCQAESTWKGWRLHGACSMTLFFIAGTITRLYVVIWVLLLFFSFFFFAVAFVSSSSRWLCASLYSGTVLEFEKNKDFLFVLLLFMLWFYSFIKMFWRPYCILFSIPKGILLCGARSMRWLVCVIPQGDKALRLPQKLKSNIFLSCLFIPPLLHKIRINSQVLLQRGREGERGAQ